MNFDFTQAEALLPQGLSKLAFNLSVHPHWETNSRLHSSVSSKKFWFKRELRLEHNQRGKEFVRVDITTGEMTPAFDHVCVAEALSRVAGVTPRTTGTTPSDVHSPQGIAPDQLPFDTFDWTADGQAIEMTVNGSRYRCDLDSYRITRLKRLKASAAAKDHEVPSPDGKWAAFLRGNNLWIRSLETGKSRPLTTDGVKDYSYGAWEDNYGAKTVPLIYGVRLKPLVLWSPDSTRLLTHRLDKRRVRKLPVMQFVPDGEYTPARMIEIRQPMAGDEEVPTAEFSVFSVDGSRVDFQMPPIELRILPLLFPPVIQNMWWHEQGDSIYFIHPTRGARSMQLFEVESASGVIRMVYEESADSFMDHDAPKPGSLGPDVRVLRDRGVFLWPSQESGWYHLYLHDLATGKMLNPITQGDWVMRKLVTVDTSQGWVYYLGSGTEAGRDVYLQHLYRVRLDGSDLTLLTPEDADHDVNMAPDCSSFVDTYSRVNQAPVSVLRRADGTLIRTLVEADIQLLHEAGFQFPEPFVVKADDGETDIHGVVVKPAGFDPSKKYPVVEYEYGWPGSTIVPHGFTVSGFSQSLAQLGFAVVIMDGRGTPGRSKAFHDAKHHLGDAAGLVDHVAGLSQLAHRYSWVDMERVGIFGFSSGGYGSARAILTYPDVYKVAVACSGDHDNRMVHPFAWERYMGVGEFSDYPPQDNQSLAKNLRGHLLLIHGDVDVNVPIHNTMRLVHALIHEDKEFDMLVIPNRDHSMGQYEIHRIWAYFLRHL